MPLSQKTINRAKAKQHKASASRKASTNPLFYEQLKKDFTLDTLSFINYYCVDENGTQTEVITNKSTLGNPKEGVFIIESTETKVLDTEYDLSKAVSQPITEEKLSKVQRSFVERITKRFKTEKVAAKYFDFMVGSSSMVVVNPLVLKYDDRYVIVGHIDKKREVGRRLDNTWETDEALADQLTALEQINQD